MFYAPHIARLSSAVGAKFQPIRYTLSGNSISSNVQYILPLLGSGWLSASGNPSNALFFSVFLAEPTARMLLYSVAQTHWHWHLPGSFPTFSRRNDDR